MSLGPDLVSSPTECRTDQWWGEGLGGDAPRGLVLLNTVFCVFPSAWGQGGRGR